MLSAFQNRSHPTPGPSPKREGSGGRKNLEVLFVVDRLYLASKHKAPSLFGEGVGGGVRFPGENNLQSFLNRLLNSL